VFINTTERPTTGRQNFAFRESDISMTSFVSARQRTEKDRSFNYFRKMWIENRCLKHSVSNRRVGAFPMIFCSKTLGFRATVAVLPLENLRSVMTFSKKAKNRSQQPIEK